MNVVFSKKFERQFDKLNHPRTRKQIAAAVKSIIQAKHLEGISSIKN